MHDESVLINTESNINNSILDVTTSEPIRQHNTNSQDEANPSFLGSIIQDHKKARICFPVVVAFFILANYFVYLIVRLY